MDSDSALEFHQGIIMLAMVVTIGYERRSKKSSYENDQNRYEQTLFHDCTSIFVFYFSKKDGCIIHLLTDRGSLALILLAVVLVASIPIRGNFG